MRKSTNIEYISLLSELANVVADRARNKKLSQSLRTKEWRLRKILKMIEESHHEKAQQALKEKQ